MNVLTVRRMLTRKLIVIIRVHSNKKYRIDVKSFSDQLAASKTYNFLNKKPKCKMEQQLKGSCKQQTSETPSYTETATYTET